MTVPSRILRAGIAALLWTAPPVSAHRTDEYLQAVLIGIEPNSVLVDLALTPGSGMAEPLLRLMDPDGDGGVSGHEGRRYAQSVGRDIVLSLDGQTLDPGLAEFFFAAPASVREGTGTSRLVWKVELPPMPPGEHRLEWHNRHLPGLSVYLSNALQPESPRLAVLRQERSTNQSELVVRFRLEPEPGSTSATSDSQGSPRTSDAGGGRTAGIRPTWFEAFACMAAAAIPLALLLKRGRRR